MRLTVEQDRLIDGQRKRESAPFSLETLESVFQQAKREIASGKTPLDPFTFLLIFVALIKRRLPDEQFHYHSFHVEFLAQAHHGEEVHIDMKFRKQETGRGWKISARFLNSEGEYLAVAEILASRS